VKSEPSTYSWDDFVRDGRTVWDGVRNPEARNHLAAMKTGDAVLFYHSGDGKEVVGLAKVVREAFPDPKADDPKWLAVEFAAQKPLARGVTLSEIKAQKALAKIPLVTRSRLSVMPIEPDAFDAIVALSTRTPR
jgi:predicted RNA-binding protein with PUA-like domain